jgi:hypothetical protein
MVEGMILEYGRVQDGSAEALPQLSARGGPDRSSPMPVGRASGTWQIGTRTAMDPFRMDGDTDNLFLPYEVFALSLSLVEHCPRPRWLFLDPKCSIISKRIASSSHQQQSDSSFRGSYFRPQQMK